MCHRTRGGRLAVIEALFRLMLCASCGDVLSPAPHGLGLDHYRSVEPMRPRHRPRRTKYS